MFSPHSFLSFSTVRNSGRKGFTLIELLTVVAIVAVLVGLLFPAIGNVMARSKRTQCAANLRQLFMASEGYSLDNEGRSIPGSKNGSSDFWLYILRPYLGGQSMWDATVDNKVRCPACKSKDKNYWAWGFGMNAKPGFQGATTSAFDKYFNWGDLTSWTRPFQSTAIVNKSRRLFICDANEWQIQPPSSATGVASFPEYNRHGKETCNVLFFDGHVECLKTKQINSALFDPGS